VLADNICGKSIVADSVTWYQHAGGSSIVDDDNTETADMYSYVYKS